MEFCEDYINNETNCAKNYILQITFSEFKNS